jgi:hypothetical protein
MVCEARRTACATLPNERYARGGHTALRWRSSSTAGARLRLFDIFRAGKVVAHVAKSVKNQRATAQELRALPMPEFIARCLEGMHSEHTEWKATARAARPDAQAMAAAKRLPPDLAEFYAHCDGFEATPDFPASVLALGELRLGADHPVPPSRHVEDFWKEYGNDCERQGWMTVLPPDNLLALASNNAETHVRPASLDVTVPLVPMDENGFAVVLLAGIGDALPAGTVLEYENGSATRYDDFRHWLATQASLFLSMRAMSGQ